MANRNNSGRTKKFRSYKPYDTSNSFVKRLITDVLPQNSWISRWLSPASNVANVRGAEIEDEEDEEEERQPPSKKIRYENATPGGADYSHQNNVNRLGKDEGDLSLSPILSSRIVDDGAVAGPSGLHLRRSDSELVSSTPAFSHPPPPSHSQEPDVGRARGISSREDVEDGSGSDSTSGCSSLLPQTERPSPYATPMPSRRVQLTPRVQLSSRPYSHTPRSSSVDSRRLHQSTTLMRSNSSRSELNTSQGLSFDPYVFVNPLNKSLTGRASLNDSCFYGGRTMFGGSAAASSHNSLLGAVDMPLQVVTVKPTVSPQRDTIGASAQRILRALEQFSTPVLDARRVPAARTESYRKRKAPPFEELIIPSMPTLLRIKRREVGRTPPPATSSSSPAMLASISSSAAMTSSRAVPLAAPSTSFSSVLTAPSTSAAPPSTSTSSHYSIREDNSKDKHIGCIKGRKKDDVVELERVEVNLPNIALPISSLPKFNLGLPKAQPVSDPLTKPPAEPMQDKTSSSESTASVRHLFKFSEPDHAPVTQADIISDLEVSPFTFSQPLTPQSLEKGHKTEPPSVAKTSEIQQPQTPLMKLPTPNYKLKRKTQGETKKEPSTPALGIKPPTELKSGSVMDFFCKNATTTTTTNLKDKFKPPADSWKCSVCLINNDKEKTKCAACETPKEKKKKDVVHENSLSSGKPGQTFKGFEGFKKPADTWECKECFVRNKNSEDSCVACSTSRKDKPKVATSSLSSSLGHSSKPAGGSTTSTTAAPLLNSFIKKPSGSWECDTCLVSNKAETITCVACSTPKPGTASDKQKPTFSFGLPSDTTTSGFQFGIPPSSASKTESHLSVPKITFGVPSDDKKQSSTPTNFRFGATDSKPCAEPSKTFSFGNMPQTTDKENEATKLTVPNAFTFGAVENSEKEETQKKDQDMPPSKKRVSFGNPITTEKIFTSDSNSSSNVFVPAASTVSATSTATSNFLFTPKTPLFGETGTTASSGKETAPVSNNLFTFGKSEPPKVESQLATTKASKSENHNNGLFGFPPSNSSVQVPSSADNKIASPFSITSDKPNKGFNAAASVVAKPSFTFGAVTTESSNTSVPKETPLVNNIFMTSKTNSDTVFNAGKSEEKKPTFFNEQPSENKPSFFNSNADSKNIFGGNKTEEWSQKTTFGSGGSNSGFETKVSQAPQAPFGSSAPASNSVENKIFSFNAVATTQQNNPAPFSFSKHTETTENKQQPPSTGFSFLGSSQTTAGQQTGGVGGFSFTAPAPATAPAPSGFGAAPVSATTAAPFGQQQAAPVFSPPEQKPFVFGAAQAQQQQASVFSFSAPPSQTTAAPGPVAPSSTFGGFSAPSTEPSPPMFDPNLKPSFNFTGGATPSFSASPGATPPTLMSENGERKRILRRAIRRTTQNR